MEATNDPREDPLILLPHHLAFKRIQHNLEKEGPNCIPSPFPRLSTYIPGIEHYTMSMITGNSGTGKTQYTDFSHMYHPVDYYLANKDKIRLKIFYYSFEMDKSIKATQAMCHHLYKTDGIRVSLKNMLSLNKKLDKEIFGLVKKNMSFFDDFYDVVEINDQRMPPYAMYMQLWEYGESIGTMHYKEVDEIHYSKLTGNKTVKKRKVVDWFEPKDPDLYTIVIVDHAALLSNQKGKDKRETLEAYGEYMMRLRNQFGFSIVSVNQQSSSQEEKDNYHKPTLSGLGDNKAIQRDFDYIFGIYNPERHKLRKHNGWDIDKLPKRYREVSVLKNRYGPSDIESDFLFDGATNYFWELANATDSANAASVAGSYEFAKTLKFDV